MVNTLGDQGKEEQMMSTSTRYARMIYLDTRLCYVTVDNLTCQIFH